MYILPERYVCRAHAIHTREEQKLRSSSTFVSEHVQFLQDFF